MKNINCNALHYSTECIKLNSEERIVLSALVSVRVQYIHGTAIS
jgi:hypothetical protein